MENLDRSKLASEVLKLSSLASALKTSLEAETDGEFTGAAEILHDGLMNLLAALHGDVPL